MTTINKVHPYRINNRPCHGSNFPLYKFFKFIWTLSLVLKPEHSSKNTSRRTTRLARKSQATWAYHQKNILESTCHRPLVTSLQDPYITPIPLLLGGHFPFSWKPWREGYSGYYWISRNISPNKWHRSIWSSTHGPIIFVGFVFIHRPKKTVPLPWPNQSQVIVPHSQALIVVSPQMSLVLAWLSFVFNSPVFTIHKNTCFPQISDLASSFSLITFVHSPHPISCLFPIMHSIASQSHHPYLLHHTQRWSLTPWLHPQSLIGFMLRSPTPSNLSCALGISPVSRHDIIGVSNGSVDVAEHITIVLVMGWPTVGLVG